MAEPSQRPNAGSITRFIPSFFPSSIANSDADGKPDRVNVFNLNDNDFCKPDSSAQD